MAYIPTEWKDGDIITAEKLNKIETGISEGGGYIVNVKGMKTLFEGELEYSGEPLGTGVDIDSPVTPVFPVSITFDGVVYDDLELKWSEIVGLGTYLPHVGANISIDISSGISYDWSEYPFCVILSSSEFGTATKELTELSSFNVYCQSAPQNVNFKFEYTDKEIEVSEDFKTAVQQTLPDTKISGILESTDVSEQNPLGLAVTFSEEAQRQIISQLISDIIPNIMLYENNTPYVPEYKYFSPNGNRLVYTFSYGAVDNVLMELKETGLGISASLKPMPTTQAAGIYLYVNTSNKPTESTPITNCIYMDKDCTELATIDKITSPILGYIVPSVNQGATSQYWYAKSFLDVTSTDLGEGDELSLVTHVVSSGDYRIGINSSGNAWSFYENIV